MTIKNLYMTTATVTAMMLLLATASLGNDADLDAAKEMFGAGETAPKEPAADHSTDDTVDGAPVTPLATDGMTLDLDVEAAALKARAEEIIRNSSGKQVFEHLERTLEDAERLLRQKHGPGNVQGNDHGAMKKMAPDASAPAVDVPAIDVRVDDTIIETVLRPRLKPKAVTAAAKAHRAKNMMAKPQAKKKITLRKKPSTTKHGIKVVKLRPASIALHSCGGDA